MWNEKPQLKLYSFNDGVFKLNSVIDDYQECSFSRNLFDSGEFVITINMNIPNAKKFKKGMFVQFGDDPYDVGEINTVGDPLKENGKVSQIRSIRGFDARIIFRKRIIKNMNANGKWEMTGAGEKIIRSLVRDQCGDNAEVKRRLPVHNTFPENFLGEDYSASETYGNLYDVLRTVATQTKIGWRMKMVRDGFILEFYEGADVSEHVKFSPTQDALRDGELTDSNDNFTNAVYVGGKGTDDDRDIYEGESGSPVGLDRVESWDDQSSLTTEAEYENEAFSMLNEFAQTLSVSANGLAKGPYEYKKQYDVGDTILISFNGRSVKSQILSVSESWSKGGYDIDFEFGKPIPLLNDQLHMMLTMIHKASNKTSTTDSVRWYTIPTDTEMPSYDVTYKTIGFIGDAGTNATFRLFLDDERNGAKTYHVWIKQLAGSGKLTLTTGFAGAINLALNPGTYVAIINVDVNGNIYMSSGTPSDTINSGSNLPPTSNAVYEMKETLNESITEMGDTLNDSITSVENAIAFYGVCSSGESTVSKTVTVQNFTLKNNATIKIKMTSKNTATNPTLNVNNTGAFPIIRYGTTAVGTSGRTSWDDGCLVEFMFDGSSWVIVGFRQNADYAYSADVSRSTAQCGSSATTSAKVASMRGYSLIDNSNFLLSVTNANSYPGKMTLNVNNTGAKDVFLNGVISSSSNYSLPNGTFPVLYNNNAFWIDTDGGRTVHGALRGGNGCPDKLLYKNWSSSATLELIDTDYNSGEFIGILYLNEGAVSVFSLGRVSSGNNRLDYRILYNVSTTPITVNTLSNHKLKFDFSNVNTLWTFVALRNVNFVNYSLS